MFDLHEWLWYATTTYWIRKLLYIPVMQKTGIMSTTLCGPRINDYFTWMHTAQIQNVSIQVVWNCQQKEYIDKHAALWITQVHVSSHMNWTPQHRFNIITTASISCKMIYIYIYTHLLQSYKAPTGPPCNQGKITSGNSNDYVVQLNYQWRRALSTSTSEWK